MTNTAIQIGDPLFLFTSFQDWVNSARRKFENFGVTGDQTLCLDTKGRVCRWGKHFMIARDDGSFPITVYALRSELVAAESVHAVEGGAE